jgi:hypothetical protein
MRSSKSCSKLASRWTPSGPNEIGIDGYIELFDANSGKPLGLTLAVQSKVVSALAGESEKTFDYWCDANDLGYWHSGDTPVILPSCAHQCRYQSL